MHLCPELPRSRGALTSCTPLDCPLILLSTALWTTQDPMRVTVTPMQENFSGEIVSFKAAASSKHVHGIATTIASTISP